MLDMVSKGAAYGMPSLQARKRRNMVREMSDQLLDGPDKVIDEEESDEASEDGEKYYLYPTTTSANSGPSATSSAASARQQQQPQVDTNQDLIDDLLSIISW